LLYTGEYSKQLSEQYTLPETLVKLLMRHGPSINLDESKRANTMSRTFNLKWPGLDIR